MERTMTVEEKIRRAEEIYARRQAGSSTKTATVNINTNTKKDLKLLKKMIIQIIISLLIYFTIYIIQNNNYIFSQDFINKAKEILSYDINFQATYENLKQYIINFNNKNQDNSAIGGANEATETNDTSTQNQEQTEENQQVDNPTESTNEQQTSNNEQELSEEEQQINKIKATTTFIKPIDGTISSKYGQREPTTATVPKNHTGVDIAANMGTKIKAATSGEVVLASEEGDYGKHLKIQIGEVSIIYAHCNNLYVKQGDKIEQGQEIAEVGSTGNSTGPHLHFEIRLSEKTIDPQKILDL